MWILEYFVVYLLYIYVRLVMSSYQSVLSTSMLGVSHAVEVLVLGLLVVYKIPYSSSCIFNTAVVVACVILVFTHGFSRCRGY